MGLIQEFKQFAIRGNVMDMTIGVIIGGAFSKIIGSLVSDILMPAIGLILGGINLSEWKLILKKAITESNGNITPAVTINIGSFIEIIFDFFLIAFVIFVMLKAINNLINKKKDIPTLTKEERLLTEIRDILKQNSD